MLLIYLLLFLHQMGNLNRVLACGIMEAVSYCQALQGNSQHWKKSLYKDLGEERITWEVFLKIEGSRSHTRVVEIMYASVLDIPLHGIQGFEGSKRGGIGFFSL